MQSHNIPPAGKPTPDSYREERLGYISRKPQRISITVSHSVHEALVEASLSQGRSLSNLASYLLEHQAELMRKRVN
jgi:hypothetical protein